MYEAKPVHSLLFVKSIPTIRFEDSKPARAKASVTYLEGSLVDNINILSIEFMTTMTIMGTISKVYISRFYQNAKRQISKHIL